MKWLVLVLFLLNVMLFAFFNYANNDGHAKHFNLGELHPENIKILTPEQLAALPTLASQTPSNDSKVSSVSDSAIGKCYEWGNFSMATLAHAREVLVKLSLSATEVQHNTAESTRYWIYIPPKASLEQAQEKVDELHKIGIDDSYVVQEPKWRFAISLGMFKDEQLAIKFLDNLKSKGVKSAVKGIRTEDHDQTSLIIKGVTPEKLDSINKMKPDFTGNELKELSC